MQRPLDARSGTRLVPGVMRRIALHLSAGRRQLQTLRRMHNPVVMRWLIADHPDDTLHRSEWDRGRWGMAV
jgi:hypothetical protein